MALFVGPYRQGLECSHRRCAATPDSEVDKLPKFPLGQFLDGQLADDRRIAAAHGAAGNLDLLRNLALTRFEVGEAFAFTLLGHNHHPSNGLPAGFQFYPRECDMIDRKSVVEGKSGSVSVALGGRRVIKKKKK